MQNGDALQCAYGQTSSEEGCPAGTNVLPGAERRVVGLRKYKVCGECPRNYDVVDRVCVRARRCKDASAVYDEKTKTCRFARFHKKHPTGYDVENVSCEVYDVPDKAKNANYYVCNENK